MPRDTSNFYSFGFEHRNFTATIKIASAALNESEEALRNRNFVVLKRWMEDPSFRSTLNVRVLL